MTRKFSIIACIFLFSFSSLFFSCSSYTSDFDFEALKAECTENGITLSNDNPYIVLMPKNTSSGLIFYPGGLVSYESYLPLMVKFAKKGIACFLVQMPSDFAILDSYAAYRVQQRYTEINKWYIGGHSLGGAMAASYASSHAKDFTGLVLLAAYSTNDLSSSSLKVLSIYGSLDGVLNRSKYNTYKSNLPSDYTEVIIEGGNHGQFGNYGFQSGDNAATITSDSQQTQTATALATFCGL